MSEPNTVGQMASVYANDHADSELGETDKIYRGFLAGHASRDAEVDRLKELVSMLREINEVLRKSRFI